MIATVKTLGLAVSVIAATAGPGAMAADLYAIDSSQSHVVFLVSHLGYSMTIGRMNKVEGEIRFDQAAVERASVEVTIEAASIDTNHGARDDELRSANFFDVAQYPSIEFKSTAVEQTGENIGKVTGDLTLLAVTKPVTLEVTFNRKAPHPIPSYNGVVIAGFSARGKITRSDFGMTAYLPALGDEVELLIEIEAFQQ